MLKKVMRQFYLSGKFVNRKQKQSRDKNEI